MHATTASIFNCSTETLCTDQKYICNDNEDCYIYCWSGYNTCNDAKFICPNSKDYSCNVIYHEELYGITNTRFHAENVAIFTLTVNVKQSLIQTGLITKNVTIFCPDYGICDINCGGAFARDVCMDMNVYSGEESQISIEAKGDSGILGMNVYASNADSLSMYGAGQYAFSHAHIYCPINRNNKYSCNVTYQGDGQGGFSGTQIYAVNSFNDINIVCKRMAFLIFFSFCWVHLNMEKLIETSLK